MSNVAQNICVALKTKSTYKMHQKKNHFQNICRAEIHMGWKFLHATLWPICHWLFCCSCRV